MASWNSTPLTTKPPRVTHIVIWQLEGSVDVTIYNNHNTQNVFDFRNTNRTDNELLLWGQELQRILMSRHSEGDEGNE